MATLKFTLHVLVAGTFLSCYRSEPQVNCLEIGEPMWAEIGGPDLEFRCSLGCQCTSTVTWYKQVRERWSLLKKGGQLNVPVHDASVGGLYRCQCGSCNSCFRVGVKPAIVKFAVQPPAARVGESLTLNCSAVGFPNLTYEIAKKGGGLVGTDYKNTGIVTLSNVNLTRSGEYTCYVYCMFPSGPPYQCQNTTNATVYDPPKIVSVSNATAELEDSSEILLCFVKNTTLTYVTWVKGDTKLHQGSKYSFKDYWIAERAMLRFLLVVHNLSTSDIGEYKCVVGSPFNDSETVASVWIEDTERGLPSSDPPPEKKNESNTGPVVGGICGSVIIAIAMVSVLGGWILYRKKVMRQEAAERQNGAITGNDRNGATISESPPGDTRETGSVNTLNDVATSSEAHDGDSMSLPSCSGSSSTPRYSDTNLMDLIPDDDNRNGHLITPHEREQLNLRIVIKGAPSARCNRGSSLNLRRRPMPRKTDTRRAASSQD